MLQSIVQYASLSKSNEENEYLKNLKTLNKIREILKGPELNLSQMCVIGDQSSGKSALLGQLTGVDFPVNSGICTKAPCVVRCFRDSELKANEYLINDREVDAEDVAAAISKQQQLLIQSGDKISYTEITVTVKGPELMDIIIVDLPGIIHHGAGKKETVALIKKYIEPKQTLIIVVSEAKQDREGIKALGLAEEFDKIEERTLRVLTKCDVFDSEESQERAIALINEGKNDDFGPHAVICRFKGTEYSKHEELKQFNAMGLKQQRAGVDSLKQRLPLMFSKLIRENLPGLKKQIHETLIQSKEELAEIGSIEPNPTSMIQLCQNEFKRTLSSFEQELGKEFESMKENIHSTGDKISKEWTDSKVIHNPYKCPFFQGEEAFKVCTKEITKWWQEYLEEFMDASQDIMEASIDCEVGCASATLVQAINIEWQEFCAQNMELFRNECRKVLMREEQFGTCNNYLTAKYVEQMMIPDSVKDDFYSSFQGSDFTKTENGKKSLLGDEDIQSIIKNKLEATLKDYLAEFSRKSLYEQQQQRVFAAVKAHWSVEKETFLDNILKINRDVINKKREEWINVSLLTNERILKCAVENKSITHRRRELKAIIQRMKQCQKEINQIN